MTTSATTEFALCMLAAGALSGWLVVLRSAFPQVVTRLGIRSPRRLLQTHLACLMWGPILIAVDLAVPDRPTWSTAVLLAGAVVSPALYLPLAFREQWAATVTYRAISGATFVAINIGLIVAAGTALMR